jgi:Holliday junction resolvase RusA-like endonuclease
VAINLTIPGRLPSLNETLRMHWAKRAKIVDGMEWILATSGQRRPAYGLKCRVKLVVYQKTRRFDVDNVHGACKPVLDALRKTGFIYRDSPDWLDLEIKQVLDHKNPRVEIEVEELP